MEASPAGAAFRRTDQSRAAGASMDTHDFFTPPSVIYGPGAMSCLADEVRGLGRRALLGIGRGALRRTGTLDAIHSALCRHDIEVVLFEGVESDPSIETVDRGAHAAVSGGCDMVVAAGGGSVIDAGKAVAAMVTNSGSVRHYLEGKSFAAKPIPCVAIPTTSGTGSEVTRNSVLTNRQDGYKRSIRHRWLIPALAIVDPELTLSLPPPVTASTGMDALAQLIEPYVSRKSTPLTDALAIYGIALVGHSLKRAVENGGDIQARADMSLASLMSGMALANAGLGAAHALSHPLGAHFGIPHGCSCAMLLPHVMEFNFTAAQEKLARTAAALGEETRGLTAAEAAGRAVARVRRLAREIGIPAGLSEFGVCEKDLERLAREAHGSSLDANPVEARDEELVKILREAL